MKGNYIHVVYFWLKEPDNQKHKERFRTSVNKFVNNSKHIESVHVGTPDKAERPVIDDSYSFSLIVTFDSKEQHDQYQTEPGHLTFIEESEELWNRVQVYDSILIDG